MSVLRDGRVLGLAVGIVLVLVGLLADAVLGLLALLEVLGGRTAEPLLVALVRAALPYLAVGLVLVAVGVVLLAALVAVLLSAADVPERLRSVAERVERDHGLFSTVGVEEFVTGDARNER